MSKILKLFMPSSAKLAKMAANAIQKAVNESGKEEMIAKYGSMADKATEIQRWVTGMIKDGKIDESERDQIAEELAPLFQKVLELI